MTFTENTFGPDPTMGVRSSDISFSKNGVSATLTFMRPDARNSLRPETLEACHAALDDVLAEPECRLIFLCGNSDAFCTGLDFGLAATDASGDHGNDRGFAGLLRRISTEPIISAALVEGQALAGGVGVASACDVVIASPTSSFRLTEAMWGVLPANIAPYLMRRMGFQSAYRMALTAHPLSAEAAEQAGLVDILSKAPDAAAKTLVTTARRLSREAIGETKSFFQSIWFADDALFSRADAAMKKCFAKPEVRSGIARYVQTGRFPWEPD